VLPALLNAAATCFLAGVGWVVQLVVYPSFRVVGPTSRWRTFHDAHSRGIAAAVGPAWALQGACSAVLLIQGDHLPFVVPIAALAAAAVALTVIWAVPAHRRLEAYDEQVLSALRRVHAWRTAAWSAGAVLSGVLIAAQA
jgi:hypothetical protein